MIYPVTMAPNSTVCLLLWLLAAQAAFAAVQGNEDLFQDHTQGRKLSIVLTSGCGSVTPCSASKPCQPTDTCVHYSAPDVFGTPRLGTCQEVCPSLLTSSSAGSGGGGTTGSGGAGNAGSGGGGNAGGGGSNAGLGGSATGGGGSMGTGGSNSGGGSTSASGGGTSSFIPGSGTTSGSGNLISQLGSATDSPLKPQQSLKESQPTATATQPANPVGRRLAASQGLFCDTRGTGTWGCCSCIE